MKLVNLSRHAVITVTAQTLKPFAETDKEIEYTFAEYGKNVN